MSVSVALFMILSGFCLIPTLVSGALSDIKSRIFPAKEWDTVLVKAGGIVTIICYLYMIGMGWYLWLGLLVGISIVSSLFFYAMGLRFGSGGDWRALMYIAIICPLLIVPTVIFSLVVGAVLAVATLFAKEDEITHRYYRSIPFALAILAGFVGAIVYSIIAWT